MNVIGSFSRQAIRARNGDAGQALPLLLVVMTAILTLVLATVYVSHLGAEKVRAANGSDSLALSAATWEARCLNVISALNDGVLQCFRVIRWTCAVWAALAAGAALGVGVPAFVAYSRKAPGIIRSYWNCAAMLVDWSEKVKKAAPWIVAGETARLAVALKAAGLLFPNDPAGPHDGKNTLELHLAKGPPLNLPDALGPITGFLRSLGKKKWLSGVARHVKAVLNSSLKSLAGAGCKPLRMLVPEDDLPRRQKTTFRGSFESSPLPPSLSDLTAGRRLYSESAAEVYGGGATLMTWRSRLVPVEEIR